MQDFDWAIKTEGLTKVYLTKLKEEVMALDKIDMCVKRGQLTALIGPDGAGKTTLMRLICGLTDKTAGSLNVLGLESKGNEQAVQDQLSYMPQKFGLYEDLTIAENMTLYADLHGVPLSIREKRFPHLLEMTGLSRFTERLAGKLSGGMKQKLGLACTLVRSPSLLLLDEPTVGVDPLSRRELWSILKQLVAEENLTVFVSTAYMDEAEQCDEVFVLNHGRVLAKGTPSELRGLAKDRCFEIKPPVGMGTRLLQSNLLKDERITDAVPSHGIVHFIVDKLEYDQAYWQSQGIEAHPVTERLEDAFMILLHEDSGILESGINDALLEFTQPKGEIETDIEVKDLVRKFGDFTAVSHTSFSVKRGEVFGLLGPNGAGKTTTFRMLCGLLPATSGFLNVAGVNLRTARTQARANIGYVAQKFSLYGNLTVYENLRFYGGAYGLAGENLKKRLQHVLEEFQLEDKVDMVAADLPGGYKQRLSMAAALIHEPKILFLDEPTSGIDPLARRAFWQRISELSKKGTTIIITTHFMEEAEYCDRFMIQDHGELLVIGSPLEIRERMDMLDSDMNEIFIEIIERSRKGGDN